MHIDNVKQFCLTVRESFERNERVQQRFKDNDLDVEFFYGLHGQTIGIQPTQTVWDTNRDNTFRNNPGKLSITISKLMLFQHILDKGYDEVLIYENDVTFVDNYREEFEQSYQLLPENWEAAHCGSCCIENKPTVAINSRISTIKYPLCCHAILWKKEAIRKAYEAIKIASWGSNSDIILERAVYPKMNHYCFIPQICFQEDKPSEAAQTVVWQDVQGWFTPCMRQIYNEQLDSFGHNPAKIAEIGCWYGASTIYLADEIKRRLKPVTLYAIDTWKGSANESQMDAPLKENNGDIYHVFMDNVAKCGVMHYITPMRMSSVEAASKFADGELNFAFIDGDHSCDSVKADLEAYYPKIHYNSTLAGHDFPRDSVKAAVEEFCKKHRKNYRVFEQSWLIDACHRPDFD